MFVVYLFPVFCFSLPFCCTYCSSVFPSMGYSRQLNTMKKTLFEQGYLDEQFHQLEELQDDASPNFVEEVVTLFFRDSTRLVGAIDQALGKTPHDFERLDTIMHQFKGSCSGIGALRVKNECTIFREQCVGGKLEGCIESFHKIKRELTILNQKLETYFQLQRKLGTSQKPCIPSRPH